MVHAHEIGEGGSGALPSRGSKAAAIIAISPGNRVIASSDFVVASSDFIAPLGDVVVAVVV
jgi:hypothetical protein